MLRRCDYLRVPFTFLTAYVISACQALRNCEGIQCQEDHRCCAPGNGSAAVRCCKLPHHTFFDNVGWMTRKLSGVLILLLLFAMGYFIQRIVCPRPRRHSDRPEEPSLFSGQATSSQDSLLVSCLEHNHEGITSPVLLPGYDKVKYLPTYEETMREVGRCLAIPGTVPGRSKDRRFT